MIKKIGFGALALAMTMCVGFSAQASYVEIIPKSYTFDRATDTGSYQYHDWTGKQLIDGQYGIAPWSADLGNGHAYEWLGWANDRVVNIDFDFGDLAYVDRIAIGTVQDHVNDVVIPNATVYTSNNGSSWNVLGTITTPESSSNNNAYLTLLFDKLAATAQYFRVSLSFSLDGPWTFTDEVDFYGANIAQTPLPATAWMFGAGVAGLAYMRRRKNRKA